MIRTAIILNVGAALVLAGLFVFLLYAVPVRAGETICGKASWYGSQHQGRTMANGRPFNMHALTAAMWGPKFGTKYHVTYKGRSVVVTITDRGPAKRLGRIIDLSQAAAAKLGMIDKGVGSVCLTRLR